MFTESIVVLSTVIFGYGVAFTPIHFTFNTVNKTIKTINTVSVYDISGKLVLSTNEKLTSISHLNKGIYILKSESKEVARKSYSSGTKRYLIFVYNDHEEAINQGDFCDSSFCRKKIKLFNNHLHLVVGHFSDSRYLTVFNTEIEFSNDKSG